MHNANLSKGYKDEKAKLNKKLDIFNGVVYTIKKDQLPVIGPDPSNPNHLAYYTSKLSISDTTTTTITTSGHLEKTGRKYVSERAVDTVVTEVNTAVDTGSCSTQEVGCQYSHQQLTADAVHRICTSKKMAKFLKNVVPIMEEELEKNHCAC
uniref:Uncharacterized protein n=1 Tax=Ditylenchus dipsaci TaxID=166011 RepID=A0A915E862_9BILA